MLIDNIRSTEYIFVGKSIILYKRMESEMFILPGTDQTSSPSLWNWFKSFIPSDAFRNLIAAATLVLAVIAGFRALAQWKESKRIKRAEYIKELTDKIRSDDDIAKTLYQIEYNVFIYSMNFHGSGELERQVDKTLSYFSYICYLKKHKILTSDEFRFFDYEVTRIFQNMDIVNYLYNLYHFSQKQERPISFCYLVDYGLENGLLDEDFTNPKACEVTNEQTTEDLEYKEKFGNLLSVPKYSKILNF